MSLNTLHKGDDDDDDDDDDNNNNNFDNIKFLISTKRNLAWNIPEQPKRDNKTSSSRN